MNPATTATLREGVKRAYSAAAREPASMHPFPVGHGFALSLGYPEDLLKQIPGEAVAAFAGVGNISCFAPLSRGDRVLDVGSGSGLDSFVASRCIGSDGAVIGVDFSEDMLLRARRCAHPAADRILFVQAPAEHLPLADGTIDVAMVNGIFNLNPHRALLFRELARVLRSGGQLAGAELVLREPLAAAREPSPESWFS